MLALRMSGIGERARKKRCHGVERNHAVAIETIDHALLNSRNIVDSFMYSLRRALFLSRGTR